MSTNPTVILLAEDDDNDVFFMRRALQKAGVTAPLQVVHNGQEAIDYLSGTGKFRDRQAYPLPSTIFLDLKMPFLDGFDVLAWIRNQPAIKDILVYILTSSAEERDRQKAEQLGAKAYFVKPPTPQMISDVMLSTAGASENAVTSA